MSIFSQDIERIKSFHKSTNAVATLFDDGLISENTMDAAALDISKALTVDKSVVTDEFARLFAVWEEWEKE
jgi:hypothetical protein